MAAQKGILKLRLVGRGRAAHSGYPETGASAIAHLLDALARVRALPLDMDALLGPAFLNIGRIAGGVAVNVLAPAAEAELLFRTVAPADDILTRVADVLGS